jgi:XTP/dITP diphosphohydrolase
MRSLLLATNNKGKISEIKALLDGLGITLHTPAELGIALEIEEDGKTYAENALKKAVAFAQASGMVSMGDDSGLEVDVLDGQPGIHSHRFCPTPNATDADRRKYLLKRLASHPRPWNAHFQATIVIAQPEGRTHLAAGYCYGEIIPVERGTNGFGYDPIFLLPEIGKTMAELTMEEKNHLSHRANAVRNSIPTLKAIFMGKGIRGENKPSSLHSRPIRERG